MSDSTPIPAAPTSPSGDRSSAAAGPAPEPVADHGPLEVSDGSGADAGVRTLTLRRPRSFNAFSAELKQALLSAMRDAATDESVRALVLTGSGRAFSAGQDLKEHAALVAQDPAAAAATVADFYNPLIRLVTSMPKPVIAAVNGVAAGAGAGLAYACDLRVAGRSAVFRTSFAQVGLSADSGLSVTLQALVGAGRARRLMFLDEPLDASTALEWGAVDLVVEDELLSTATADLARRLAAGPTTAYGFIKRSLQIGGTGDLEAALAFEDRAQQICFASSDHREALAAFAAKRSPEFSGR